MTTPSAEALRDIYEPAFEAAGERPVRMGAALKYLQGTWAWVPVEHRLEPDRPNPDEHEGWNDPIWMGAEDAANACECWAVKRLLEMYMSIEKRGHEFRVYGVGADPDLIACGPTIHHALSAAMQALARPSGRG